MKIKALIILLLSVSFFSVFSAPIDQNSDFLQAKEEVQRDLGEKKKALDTCRSACQKNYSYYTQLECDSRVCSTEKSAFNTARDELDKIHMSQNVLQERKSLLADSENNWKACTARCLNKRDNQHSREHCKNVICQGEKDKYEVLKDKSDAMDENREKIEDEPSEEPPTKGEAVTNQIREKKRKSGSFSLCCPGDSCLFRH